MTTLHLEPHIPRRYAVDTDPRVPAPGFAPSPDRAPVGRAYRAWGSNHTRFSAIRLTEPCCPCACSVSAAPEARAA